MIEKFLKKKFKLLKNQKGLTLVELLAVIVILGVIAAIAIPAIGNIINNSRIKAAKADVVNVLNGASIYFADNPTETTVTPSTLKTYVENWGTLEGVSPHVTVSNGNPNSLTINSSASYKVGNKTVTVSGATITNIKVDKAESVTNAFQYTP